jgi:hypothetical protein
MFGDQAAGKAGGAVDDEVEFGVGPHGVILRLCAKDIE